MNLERHQRRIHWKTRLIRWTMVPAAFLAGFAWLYVSYSSCLEEGDASGSVCQVSRVIPFLPTLGAVLLAVFIVWDLVTVGRESHEEEHGVKPKHHLKHAQHGYDRIGDAHKRHIHRALATVVGVTLCVGVWIAWEAYQSTH